MNVLATLASRRRWIGILVAASALSIALGGFQASVARAAEVPAKQEPVDFGREIRPILAAHCHACHGPSKQEGGLRLHSRAAAFAGGDSGEKTISASDPVASRLVRVINGTDAELKMPPDGEGQPLSPAQAELITRWVREGANWPADADLALEKPPHWAWQKPSKAQLPAVRQLLWPRHAIDYFVLTRLDEAGLQPAAEADRHTLARRVHLDLIGLPPTPQQVDAFVNDTDANAYERMVDRVLADPAYGERWGRMWLDLARYADSKGYGSDPLRTIWRYRDWVIEAFNRNLPYDRFTIEQLAGDMLTDPSSDQTLATAFHRNTMANDEGGTDDEEFRVAAVKDRIETTMQVWMGLTMGCAKCHSHKFDPVTQREYYQAYAFFDQSEDADRGDEEPKARIPTLDQSHQVADVNSRLARLAERIAKPPGDLDAKIAEWEAALKTAPAVASASPAKELPPQIREILAVLPAQRSNAEREALTKHFWEQSPDAEALRAEIAAGEAQLKELDKQIPTTPVMRELPADKRRITHTMVKGNFRMPGEVVEPGLPIAFHLLRSDVAKNRLGLAKWLMDAENPLTARVAVNRFWAQLFGVGLVATEEDFGTQGLPPTHPQVLDWLAVELMNNGWNVKDILRQIVCSATYRQSSTPGADVLEQDPANRLLARGARFRLDAETVRDQALSVSGLLSRKQGGPSVYPPQPPGLWRAAFNGERTWATSTGEDRFRRGLYTYWRRTVPYPSMAAFDAPSREICTLRRISTNTPLQAFVLMNDPVYVEAAQALARRIVSEGGTSVPDRCEFALRMALARPPQGDQIQRLATLYQSELAHYRKDPKAATEMATDPIGPPPEGCDVAELAAWTVVSNVILNLDGVLTKR